MAVKSDSNWMASTDPTEEGTSETEVLGRLIRVLALEGIRPTLELLNTQSRGLPKPTESEILVLGPRHLHLYEALQGLLTQTPSETLVPALRRPLSAPKETYLHSASSWSLKSVPCPVAGVVFRTAFPFNRSARPVHGLSCKLHPLRPAPSQLLT